MRTAATGPPDPPAKDPRCCKASLSADAAARRMTVRYHQRRDTLVPDYRCANENIQRHGPVCLHLPGHTIDQAIEQLLLAHRHAARARGRAHRPSRARSPRQRRRPAAPLTRRPRPPARRARPPPLSRSRPRQPARRRHPRSRLERHASRAASRPRRIRPPNSRRQHSRSTSIAKPRSDSSPPISRSSGHDPATPARERKRIARLLIEDVTINKTDQIHLHVRFRGGQTTSLTIPIPLNSWQARQTDPDTFKLLDRLLDDHTDGETAATAQRRRPPHRHRQAVHRPHRAAHPPRPPAPQPPRPTPRPRSAHDHRDRPTTRRAPQHDQGLAPRRTAHLPQSQRQERATLRPARPRPTHDSNDAKADDSTTENPPNHPDEVHYETNALSYASPTVPIDASTW